MTPIEAIQWADEAIHEVGKNCQPDAVDRLRSRAAVAAYNCGPTRVARDGLGAIPAETRSYLAHVQEVL